MKITITDISKDRIRFVEGAKREMDICSKWFNAHFSKGLWWFRIFGYGVHWKSLKTHPLLFSERYGYTKKLLIGNWCFGILKPLNLK